ncbi:MAG: hypothetical protein J7K64_04005 [Bacteroidales bacterium]|nr:hypothetical protein [Bacteroidales bacterium]
MNKKNFLIGLLTILMVGSSTLSFASDQTIVSDTIPSLEKKVQTNYDLAKAKTALLKSQIALKIDKNRQKAKEELDNAFTCLSEAKSTADEKTKAEIDLLKTGVTNAKKSVSLKKKYALVKISDVFDKTKTLSEKYNDKLNLKREKDIATFNGKYMQLRAEDALLQAKIAVQSKKTYAQAQVYLKEANKWYTRSKKYSNQKINPYVEQIQKDIEDAQTYLEKKDKKARNKISDILQKASELIKKD